MNLIVKKNDEVNDDLLARVLQFDRTIFPTDGDYAFPDDYLKRMYSSSKDGIFVLLQNNEVVGYVNCIFISDEEMITYLQDRDFLKLNNIGFNYGNNNVYIYTLALKKELRGTDAIKILMSNFAEWLTQEKSNGRVINRCISEAVTIDGVKSLLAMGMVPQDIDSNGLGIYYSPDCLNDYINKMSQNQRNTR